MSTDYSFMRSGVAGATPELDSQGKEMAMKVFAIMECLMQSSMKAAVRFTEACGRKNVAAEDARRGLKYEAHEFFSRDDLEDKFTEALGRQYAYEEGEESDDSEDEPEISDDGRELYTEKFVRGDAAERQFHGKVLTYTRDWAGWHPDDPVKQAIKRAIDSVPGNE